MEVRDCLEGRKKGNVIGLVVNRLVLVGEKERIVEKYRMLTNKITDVETSNKEKHRMTKEKVIGLVVNRMVLGAENKRYV